MKGRVVSDYRSSTVPVWWTEPTELSIKMINTTPMICI